MFTAERSVLYNATVSVALLVVYVVLEVILMQIALLYRHFVADLVLVKEVLKS